MTVPLPDPTLRRLAGALALAASSSGAPDGERLAAIAAAERLLAGHGLTLADLAPRGRMLPLYPSEHNACSRPLPAALAPPRRYAIQRTTRRRFLAGN